MNVIRLLILLVAFSCNHAHASSFDDTFKNSIVLNTSTWRFEIPKDQVVKISDFIAIKEDGVSSEALPNLTRLPEGTAVMYQVDGVCMDPVSIVEKFSESGKISMLGKKHSQETKDLIGLKNSIAQKGEKNSQFGTIWITNGIKPIKIKKDDVIPEGYIRGKKFIKALDEKTFEEFNKKVYND